MWRWIFIMAYEKTDWKDRLVEKPNTYRATSNLDGTITLNREEGKITEPGTPINATNMNKLENEVEFLDAEIKNKINYVDFMPVTTTGTGIAYIAAIPTDMVEITIIPHVENLSGATLNGKSILNREGNAIEAGILKTDIPVKLVRVDNSFFLASGSGGDKYVAFGKEVATNIDATKDRGCAIDNDGNIYVKGAHYSGWYVEKIGPTGEVIWSTEIIAGGDSVIYAPINFIYDDYLYSFDLTKGKKVIKLTLDGQIVVEYPGLYDSNFYDYKINYKEKTIYTTKSKCNFETGVTTYYPEFLLGGANRYLLNPGQYSNDNYNLIKGTMNSYNSQIWVLNNNMEVIGDIKSGSQIKFENAVLLKDCVAIRTKVDGYTTPVYMTYTLDNFANVVAIYESGFSSTFLRLKGEVYAQKSDRDADLLGKNSILSVPLQVYNHVNITNEDYILYNGSAVWKVKYEKISKII
jgi:hypothetical protein